jgi:uncharacterized protein YjbJ (UPF0337 family)
VTREVVDEAGHPFISHPDGALTSPPFQGDRFRTVVRRFDIGFRGNNKTRMGRQPAGPRTTGRKIIMGNADKASNKVEDLKGKVKETTGRVTGDKDLESQGKVDQVKAAAKGVGEEIKDAGNKIKRLVNP